MDLNAMCKLAHERSVAAGWGTPGMEADPDQCLKVHMLMVTEIAEASEAVRNHLPPVYFEAKLQPGMPDYAPGKVVRFVPLALDDAGIRHAYANGLEAGFAPADLKPEGQLVELADTVIRIGDWLGRYQASLSTLVELKMDYNATRGHKHGGKAN